MWEDAQTQLVHTPIALMTKAGHSDMKTTRIYLHLAGTVFRNEAVALEQRLLGTPAGGVEERPETGSRR